MKNDEENRGLEPETTLEVEFAKRSLARLTEDARTDIREKIAWIRSRLDEAEQRLDAGELPNTCGILQSSAIDLEMAVARLAAMREAAPAITMLTNALNAKETR